MELSIGDYQQIYRRVEDENKLLKKQVKELLYANEELSKQLTLIGVVTTLPNIDSTEFRDWIKSEGFTKTLNSFLYKRGGFEYDKDVLYQHYINQLQFGN